MNPEAEEDVALIRRKRREGREVGIAKGGGDTT